MPYLDLDGQRLFFLRRAGRDQRFPPILFLHGAGGNALLWGRVMQHLPGPAAIALDLPGHGRSTGRGSATIAGYRRVVLTAADALGLDALIIAGHSMGGAIALDMALEAPERVRALVLMSVTARLYVAPALLEQLVQDPAQARQWIIETGYGPDTLTQARALGAKQLAAVRPEVLHGDFVACSVFDARSRLGEVRAPALVLCGAEDRLTPPKYVAALQEGLPRARLELIPGAGHMLPLECPEDVARAVTAFLDGSELG
jgi:pimeloyl-ACP methyl ester carboxylesterase